MHDDLMSHWSSNVPPEQWLEVSYETMVQDMDASLHTIGQFADINVDRKKLSSDAAAPTPITISYEQLGAISTTRSGRGKRYDSWFTR